MDIEIRRSGRRTVALEVTSDARVIVRAPYGLPEAELKRFIKEKSPWIEKALERIRQRKEEGSSREKLSMEDLHRLADQALAVIPAKAARYAQQVGVSYGRITIRNQRSRWGSCSSKGNLNFNCLLMLMPEEVLDYVIVHELCHRKEMNHSERFWREVERVLPDYRERRKWLKEHGSAVIDSMPG
ncbi:MAG: M48 family metallopeptidase [Lachnospiraceae bacterium]|nr:M48 family metallopeptidase [Lachnospiraceae bacterium]